MPTGKIDPVGTVRVIGVGRDAIRRIKVRADGPPAHRWADYARWWWLENRGPIPEGKRVAHLDGDKLNDDPANLALLSPGDVAFLWHDRDPEGSARNYAKLRTATAAFNRQRALIRREREYLPSKWYPVDFARRVVYNRPRRHRWEIYWDAGLDVSADTWRTCRAAALGWPGLPLLAALALAALAAAGRPLSRTSLRGEVESLRARHEWEGGRPTASALYQAAEQSPAEYFRRERRDGRPTWSITPAGIAARATPAAITPVRGERLAAGEEFTHFTRETPTYSGWRRMGCRTNSPGDRGTVNALTVAAL